MADRFLLKEKVIVVTGATGILGHSFISALAAAGAIIGVLGRKANVAEERANEIVKAGGKAIPLVADVLKVDELKNACNSVLQTFGRIDGLVNAAGGNMPGATVLPGADIFNLDMQLIHDVIQLNLYGTILSTQVFGAAIINTAGKGSIVNISSVTAQHAVTRVLGYSLAKAAVETYTKWMSVEAAQRYHDRLRINTLVPGFFVADQNRSLLLNEDGSYTERGQKVIDQTPFGRFGEPAELGGALVWLLSDASTFVNGTSIVIDGGFSNFSGV